MEVFYKLILSFCVCVTRHAKSTQNKFPYLCNISRNAWEVKLIFRWQINTKFFYKLVASLWVCIARHAQSTQNNKITISSQYIKENVKDAVDFLPADNRQRFLQSDTSILGAWPGTPNLPTITSLLFLCNTFRKKLVFCMQISMKACYKLILWL